MTRYAKTLDFYEDDDIALKDLHPNLLNPYRPIKLNSDNFKRLTANIHSLICGIEYTDDIRKYPDKLQKKQFCNGWMDAIRVTDKPLKSPFRLTWYTLGYNMGKEFHLRPDEFIHDLFDKFAYVLEYDLGAEPYCSPSQCYTIMEDDNVEPAVQISLEAEEASEALFEGSAMEITLDAYERNIKARQQCLDRYGCRCYCCTLDFGEKYGSEMDGFIHVHHRKPLSEIGEKHKIDPIEDLVPVCPNCHAVIHSGDHVRTIDEVRAMIDQNSHKRREQGTAMQHA